MDRLKHWIKNAPGILSLSAIIYIGIKYVPGIILPFAIAYFLSCVVRPLGRKMSLKLRISPRAASCLICTALSVCIAVITVLSLGALVRQSVGLAQSLAQILASGENPITRTIDKLSQNAKQFNLGPNIKEAALSALSNVLGKISSAAAGWVASIIKSAPPKLFSIAVGIISLFYFSMDRGEIGTFFKKILPEAMLKSVLDWLSLTKRALIRFSRAYLSLFAMTFFQLLIGLVIVGVDFAFPLSLIIAIIDILPVLGVGTVLVPWSLLMFVGGDNARATGLMVLFAIIYTVRQVSEPRIVGKGVGVPSVVALVAAYGGFCLGGVSGLVLSPIALYIAGAWWEEREFLSGKNEENISKTSL